MSVQNDLKTAYNAASINCHTTIIALKRVIVMLKKTADDEPGRDDLRLEYSDAANRLRMLETTLIWMDEKGRSIPGTTWPGGHD